MHQAENQSTAAVAVLLGVTIMASLVHYVHNAAFLTDYPNMPAWLSATRVYVAWLVVTTIAATGYLLVRFGYRIIGYALLLLYGVLGLDGLSHYALAPISAHTLAMNLTIWFEVIAAALLMSFVAADLIAHARTRRLAN